MMITTILFFPGPMRRSCGSTERPIHLTERIRESSSIPLSLSGTAMVQKEGCS